MAKKSSAKIDSFHYVPEDRDLPASQGMLHLVRTELKADMRAGFGNMEARFSGLEGRFSGLEGRFEKMSADFRQLSAHVHSTVDDLRADIARIGILVEEQNARNRIVLEGLTGLWQVQKRIDGRIDEVEKTVRSIAKARQR